MGGNAIKKVPIKRLPSVEELRRVQNALTATLNAQNMAHAFPIELPGKDSFGDVDVLIDLRTPDGARVSAANNLYAWIEETFSPEEIHVSGSVYSIAYESQYQVDLIVVQNLDMATFYFSYGEVGAILGRCARAHELTYGHQGLLTLGENGQKGIHLSESPELICQFFGLDYERWSRGFQSIPEINEWIVSSEIFHPRLFDSLNMSHRRQSLRPFYKQFLSFIETLPRNEEWELRNLSNVGIANFNQQEAYAQVLEDRSKKAEFKAKFNAKLFLDRGVDKFKLNEAMKKFKAEHGDVEEMSADNIALAVDDFVARFSREVILNT